MHAHKPKPLTRGASLQLSAVTEVLPFLLGRTNYLPHLPPRCKNIQRTNQHIRHIQSLLVCVQPDGGFEEEKAPTAVGPSILP